MESSAPVAANAPPATGPDPFDLFSGFTPEQADLLRSKLVQQPVKAGDVFIHNGDVGDALYIVSDGEIEVRVRVPTPDGGTEDKVVKRMGAGHVVGEMALLNREPRNADVVAVTDGMLCRLSAEDFHEICKRVPALKMVLTRVVARRLSWSDKDVLARRIGNYNVIAPIGQGGMGWVFRAVRETDQMELALKMLPHVLVERPGFLEQFRNEANIMERVPNDNIVTLYDTIEAYGTIFMAMEFVRGMTVREWVVHHGKPSVDDVRRLLRAMILALRAAHEHGVVHRDVKPDNIMIREDGVMKLMDFGIAAPVSGPMVSMGGVSLTPAYGAPEMFRGARGEPAGDFYSLGVMIYELLAGQLPLVSDTFEGWSWQHSQVPPTPLRQVCPDVPADLEEFVTAALMKDSGERWQALQALLNRFSTDSIIIRRAPMLSRPGNAPQPSVKIREETGGVPSSSNGAVDLSTVVSTPSTAASAPAPRPAIKVPSVAPGGRPVASPKPSIAAAPANSSGQQPTVSNPTVAPPAKPAAPRTVGLVPAVKSPGSLPTVVRPAAATAVPGASSATAVWMRFPREEKEKPFLLVKPLIVGREEPADICIPDDTISRRHIELSTTPQGLHVRDCNSANGTLLNEQPMSEADLRPGDQLRLGMTLLIYDRDSPTGAHFIVRPLSA